MPVSDDRRDRGEPELTPGQAYQRYGPPLVRKAERILQSREDALDVVQTLFVDAMDGRVPNLDLPYLYRVVTNRCLNVLRDSSNRRRLLNEHQPVLRGMARTTLGDRVVDVNFLASLIDLLDHDCQELLVARFIDDMTQEEAASHLRISRKTVAKRLQVIRRAAEAMDSDRRSPDRRHEEHSHE